MQANIDPDLEREYNNRAKVPDFPVIARGWATAAAAFRATHPCLDLAVPYGPSPRQTMDVFWPDTGRAAPLAVFFHGGYWQALDPSAFSHLAAGLLAHGIAVAMPSYDLCPQVTVAEIMEQARSATTALYTRHARPMLAMGHSAGGHLAACLLATDWAARGLPAGIVPAAFSLSGLFDLAPLTHTSLNAALRLDDAEATRLWPLHWPKPAGHLHAVVGAEEGDEYLRQSRAIAQAWGGGWEAMAGENHFSILKLLARSDTTLTRKAVQLSRGIFN